MQGFDPARDGFNPYENVLTRSNVTELEVAWTLPDAGSGGWGSPAIVGGVAYALRGDDTLFAVDARTGTVRWSRPLGFDASHVTPSVSNGVVYQPDTGGLHAIDAATGDELWVSPGGSYRSPAVVGNRVYIGGPLLQALDAATGDVLWTLTGEQGFFTSPAVANGVVYAAASHDGAYAVDGATGAVLWHVGAEADLSATDPTVSEGLVYFGTSSCVFYTCSIVALDATTGATQWTFQTARVASAVGGFAVADGVLYAATANFFTVYALDATAGSQMWSNPSLIGSFGSTVANDVLYIGGVACCETDDATLLAINPMTGGLLARYTVAGGQGFFEPIVADGMVLAGRFQGDLTAWALPSP